MNICGRWIFAVVLAAAPLLMRADDREAAEAYRLGREAYEKGEYRDAAKQFEEAGFMADTAVVKANALRARIAALQMCKLPYQEFEAIERMLTDFPEYADFVALVNREYELAKMYDEGVREPSFWYLRWIPWLVDGNKSVEIYRKALERAPFSDQAPRARLRLAFLLDQEGKVKESLEELRRIIRDYPHSPECKYAYLALGNGLFELSRRGDGDARYAREAHDVFREFQDKYPDAPENDFIRTILSRSRDVQAERLVKIADFYEKSGRKEAAERYLAQVLKEFPDTEQAVDSERRLAKLDKSFVPDDFPARSEPRYERYSAYKLPEESGKLLIVPGRGNNKYLLPVYDLGIGKEDDPPAAATGKVEETTK